MTWCDIWVKSDLEMKRTWWGSSRGGLMEVFFVSANDEMIIQLSKKLKREVFRAG